MALPESLREKDIVLMKQCIELSHQSVRQDGKPFAALITRNGEVVCESINASSIDKTNHAEVLALKRAQFMLKSHDLSECTIYSNCEPCAMCSFLIREFKIKRVVFALPSPYMGGYSKWNILLDREISEFTSDFGAPPEVAAGICKDEAAAVFDEIGWTMHI